MLLSQIVIEYAPKIKIKRFQSSLKELTHFKCFLFKLDLNKEKDFRQGQWKFNMLKVQNAIGSMINLT